MPDSTSSVQITSFNVIDIEKLVPLDLQHDTANSVYNANVFNTVYSDNGKQVYRHDPIDSVPAGGAAKLIINVESMTGTPKGQLVMFNPNDRSQYWHTDGEVDLVLGENILNMPTANEAYITYGLVMPDSTSSVQIGNVLFLKE